MRYAGTQRPFRRKPAVMEHPTSATARPSHLTASQFGLGFWQTWWTCALCTSTVLPSGRLIGPFDASTFLLLVTAASYLAATLASRRIPSFSRLPGACTAVAAGCALGTVGMGVASGASTESWQSWGIPLFAVAAILFALANAPLILMWGERWSTLASGAVGRCLYTSYALALAAFFCVDALPWTVRLAIMAALPVVSAVLLHLSQSEPSREARTGGDVPTPSFVRPLIAVFVLNFVWGAALPAAMLLGNGENTTRPGLLLALAGVVVLIVYMTIAKPATEAFSLSQPVGVGLAGGLILLLALPEQLLFVGYGLATLGGACLDMLVMLVATDMAFRLRRPAALALGCAMVVSRAGSLGGRALYSSVFIDMPSIAPQVILWCAFAVVVCVLVVFSQSSLRTLYHTEPALPRIETLEDRCSTLAASAGLTPREREILALLAQGRNAPFIAQALSLSTGTVKNNISSIYRKVDVGDRQGLLNLLERRPETQG